MAYSIFLLLGGIGLFLYGINFLSVSLEKAAGNNMRAILEKMTKKGFIALLVGTFVTALIQSSGATSVMVVGFVNAGLMNLVQGIYIMLGANIGTTITAQIIAFKFENIAPLILFLGMFLYLFVKNKSAKKIGGIVLGFGMLFVGIKIMGDAVDELHLSTIVANFLNNYDNPLLGLLFGVLITAIIQSSSASVGILQVIAMGGAAASGISLESVMFMILGMNIGAVSPVLLSSFTGDSNSKRTAVAALLAKIFGVIIFSIIFFIFPKGLDLIKSSSADLTRQIANFHLIFNLISSLLLFPLVKPIAKLAELIVKPDKDEDKDDKRLVYIKPEIMQNPSIAIIQFKKEIIRMANLTYDNIKTAIDSFFEKDSSKTAEIYKNEEVINYLNHTITGSLVHLYGNNLTAKEHEKVGMMFNVVTNIERIGDHAENIAEYVDISVEHTVQISDSALEELKEMAYTSLNVIKMSIDAYENEKFDLLPKISAEEEKVDDFEESCTNHHLDRLKNNECNPRGGVLYTDMVIDLERCSDHAINIAYAINGERSSVEVKKTFNIIKNMPDNE